MLWIVLGNVYYYFNIYIYYFVYYPIQTINEKSFSQFFGILADSGFRVSPKLLENTITNQ